MARGRAVSIVLSDAERGELEQRVRRRKSSHGAARRARIVLLAAGGLSNTAIAGKLGVSRRTVGLWRARFAERRLEGLDDEPRPGAPRRIGDDKIFRRFGKGHRVRRVRRVVGLAGRVMLAHCLRGREPVAEERAQGPSRALRVGHSECRCHGATIAHPAAAITRR